MRALVILAVNTGIPVREWIREDDRVVATALDLMAPRTDEPYLKG